MKIKRRELIPAFNEKAVNHTMLEWEGAKSRWADTRPLFHKMRPSVRFLSHANGPFLINVSIHCNPRSEEVILSCGALFSHLIIVRLGGVLGRLTALGNVTYKPRELLLLRTAIRLCLIRPVPSQ